jgi:hypothetical protein
VRQFTDPIKIHEHAVKLRTPLLPEPRPGILATNAQQKISAEESQ